jgi:molecular chaperone GrpE
MTKSKKKIKDLENEEDKVVSSETVEETNESSDQDTTEEVPVELSEVDQLKQQVLTLQDEVNVHKNQALRHLADLENFRKRKQQEVDSFKEYASEKVLVELFPIIDSFDLASSHSENEGVQAKDVLDGFLLIRKQIQSFLSKQGVEPIDALNKEFDPNFHQAISQEAAEGVEPDMVIKEMQKGYKLKERIVRPSMVVVST